MSFEFIIEKDNSKQVLSEEMKELLVKDISSKFVQYNSERAKNLEMATCLHIATLCMSPLLLLHCHLSNIRSKKNNKTA